MASAPVKVFTAHVKGRRIDFYDYGGSPYPALHPTIVPPEMVTAFTIPSSRIFYLNPQGVRIPYLALSDPEQTRRDVAAWLEKNNLPRVYMERTVEPLGDPEVDLFSIAEGNKVTVRPENLDRYLQQLGQVLDDYRGQRNETQRFGLVPNRRLIEQMLNYPFNPATDFLLASRLAENPNQAEIQRFLDQRGIIHFSADDIVNLQPIEIFFYLTRFYGPPVKGDLNSKMIQRGYSRRATNPRAREIVRVLPENIVTYRTLRKEFDAYFNRIVQNPEDPVIWQSLSATNEERFYRSFFDYLRLLRRREGLPPLTLNTIKQLRPINEESIVGLLADYTDQDIVHLVGNSIDEENTRVEFLQSAAHLLLDTRVFVMQPYEARLCNNAESVYTADLFSELTYPFIGRGSFATGFDCYTVEELFASWDLQRDANGDITFIDPLRPASTFRVHELTEFRDALQAGRAGIAIPQDIIRRFDDYIRQAETQATSDYPKIRQLRQWANQNPVNKELMRNYWTTYFQMGMYMRQWRGPGHPYPVERAATGREEMVGTDREIQIAMNVQNQKIQLEQIVAQMPQNIRDLINDLGVVKHVADRVESDRVKIGERYNRVINLGNYCIRMASGPWSYTGAYYLKQILNEEIPGFDLGTNVDPII